MVLSNSTLPSLVALIGSKGFALDGCNTITVLVQSQNGTQFQVQSASRLNSRRCANDNDIKYVQLLQQADSFGLNGTSFYLTAKGVKLVEFKPIAIPTTKPVSTAPAISLKGNYTLAVAGLRSVINFTLDDKQGSFVGCNSVTFQYEAHNDGYFRVLNATTLTKKACRPDYDD